jgi:hypothetical protein
MLRYSEWFDLLLEDAGHEGIYDNVLALGDFVLRMFYEDGCPPTCASIRLYALAG